METIIQLHLQQIVDIDSVLQVVKVIQLQLQKLFQIHSQQVHLTSILQLVELIVLLIRAQDDIHHLNQLHGQQVLIMPSMHPEQQQQVQQQVHLEHTVKQPVMDIIP